MAVPASAASLSPDLRKRIEIMAEHIARNGADFENTVRQKNVNNPQFAFLYRGEGAEYYNHVLAGHRGQLGASTAQQVSGGSSAAISSDPAEALKRWMEPPVYPLSADLDMQLQEVIASLEAMASRDSVRNGRAWIECNSAVATQIAGVLVRRLSSIPSAAHRLHVLYLVHDVLQTEAARKEPQKPIIRAFKPYLPHMLRPAYQMAVKAGTSGDEAGRVLRLVQLWLERAILDPREAEDFKVIVTQPEVQPQFSNQGQHPSWQASLPTQNHVPAGQPHMGGVQGMPRMPGMQQGMVRPPGMLGTTMPGAMQYGGMPGAAGMPAHAGVPCGLMAPGQMQQLGQMHQTQRLPVIPPTRPQGYQQRHFPAMAAKKSPETVPVGVLATMMMHAVRRVGKSNFVPYRPLDTSLTPQMLPPMEAPAQRLLERVEDFYQDLKDEERGSSSSRSSSSRSRSGSRSASRSRSPDQRRQSSSFGGPPPGGHPPGAMSAVPPPGAMGGAMGAMGMAGMGMAGMGGMNAVPPPMMH